MSPGHPPGKAASLGSVWGCGRAEAPAALGGFVCPGGNMGKPVAPSHGEPGLWEPALSQGILVWQEGVSLPFGLLLGV